MDLLAHEPTIRLAAFIGALAALVLIQARWPKRGDGRPAARQVINGSLVVFNTLVLRFAFPVLAVGFAVIINDADGGLFGWLDWPLWVAIPFAIVLFDLAIYWQHRLLHRIPLLWRLHRVHHCDTGFDVTTGFRFHPLEIALSMGIKLGLVWLLGPHPVAVLLFELLLATGALFTHSDFALPERWDRRLRWLVVTPSMHRIHHSTWRPETDSNYGFHLSCWDRLFGSYRRQPRVAEAEMAIGLDEFRDPDEQGLWSLLLNPFRSMPGQRPRKKSP
ncbi:MAG: sterol desaturase family protein [Wenzhouxiangella sp.]|jgi:sterol desaturase/sphingolipid hydroxylase (fatty acid hydroxylase superfamily)|nr:sterol desaturase family protein [Wenzhouxiangella sp.]